MKKILYLLSFLLLLLCITGCRAEEPLPLLETSLAEHTDILSVKEVDPPEDYADCRLFAISYESDGCTVWGYAAVPAEMTEPLPVLIYNRGGNRNYGVLQPYEVCRFAQKGFLTLGSQYRGNLGGTGREEFGGAEVNDVIKLIDIAESLPQAQSGGVYMVGHSRGGMMTYLACARDERIKAASVGAGMSDCFIMYETRDDDMKAVFHELVGGGPEEMEQAFIDRSATYWPEKINCPILICQGTNDWKVVPEQSIKMHDALEEAGKESAFILYTGADHSLKGTTFVDDTVAFLLKYPLK